MFVLISPALKPVIWLYFHTLFPDHSSLHWTLLCLLFIKVFDTWLVTLPSHTISNSSCFEHLTRPSPQVNPLEVSHIKMLHFIGSGSDQKVAVCRDVSGAWTCEISHPHVGYSILLWDKNRWGEKMASWGWGLWAGASYSAHSGVYFFPSRWWQS